MLKKQYELFLKSKCRKIYKVSKTVKKQATMT